MFKLFLTSQIYSSETSIDIEIAPSKFEGNSSSTFTGYTLFHNIHNFWQQIIFQGRQKTKVLSTQKKRSKAHCSKC